MGIMTKPDALIGHLRARQDLRGKEWMEGLEPRKREEIVFHNFERDRDDHAVMEAQKTTGVHANKKFYSIVGSSTAYVDSWLRRQVPGKVFLDYACGDGKYTMLAARYGAALSIGLDISDVSIRNARRVSEQHGLGRVCSFIQGDCEATELPEQSVDVVLCSGMLHHLDLPKAYNELRRILRPGGRILAVEALAHNPLIKWYREATPHLRTEWEKNHILRWSDIRLAERWFGLGEVRCWHLLGLMALPLRATPLFQPALRFLDGADSMILSIPGIRAMAWQVTFELLAQEPPATH